MTQRESDHWSIGEVLSLIQEEFPEVTISKIRFLESQGLISPERTPSGYRRFYQEDFERLQWILVQQRDRYLPLRVIRSRLESGDLDGVNEVDVNPVLPLDGLESEPHRPVPRVGRPLAKPSADEAASPGIVDQDNRADDTEAQDSRADDTEAQDSRADDTEAQDSRADDTEAAAGERHDTAQRGAIDLADPIEEGPAEGDVALGDPVSDPAEWVSLPADRRGKDLPEIGRNAAMTKDELAEASGCSLETIIELERFGLVSGRTIGPTVLYDGEALAIAQLAAQFVAYGLEPRHLRTLKIGAEREVGLLSQVIEPILYRRDARAHKDAMATLDNMVDITARLQAILVRQMVRELLPSQRG